MPARVPHPPHPHCKISGIEVLFDARLEGRVYVRGILFQVSASCLAVCCCPAAAPYYRRTGTEVGGIARQPGGEWAHWTRCHHALRKPAPPSPCAPPQASPHLRGCGLNYLGGHASFPALGIGRDRSHLHLDKLVACLPPLVKHLVRGGGWAGGSVGAEADMACGALMPEPLGADRSVPNRRPAAC